jgi:hypothetical protein
MRDDELNFNPVFRMTPKSSVRYVLVPENEYDDLMAELAELRAAKRRTEAAGNDCVRAAQYGCRAIDKGVVCGERTYAGHDYCPKHQQRYLRHGDPTLTRKRGRKVS